MKTYLFVYLGSTILAAIITPLIIFIARRIGIVDVPDARKVHFKPIPRVGGIAIFVSMMTLVIFVLFLDNTIGDKFRDIQLKVTALLSAAAFVFLIGLIDDIRAFSGKIKFLTLIIASLVICASGSRIDSISIATWFELDFGLVAWPLTILWIIGITVGVNFIDGLDGLAAGISAIACAVIAVFAFNSGQPLMAVIMLALLGSLSGFLFFNFNPAKIFMGDCGSMFLGFVLGSASVMCVAKTKTFVGLALLALALGLPIFDTFFTVLRRYLNRRRILHSDYGHVHHKLLDMGLNQRHVVIIMYVLTAIATGLGMFMMITRDAGTVAIFFCVLLLLVLLFRLIGIGQLQKIITRLKSNMAISHEGRMYIGIFEDAQLGIRKVTSFKDWWQAISTVAQKMDFLELSLTVTISDGSSRDFVWRKDSAEKDQQETVTVRIPIGKHRLALPLNIEAKISINRSLESAGQRMMLFGRLIDEYCSAGILTENLLSNC